VAAALQECKRAFWSVALFSGVVNILMLAGPLYMLQIYDRVLSSRSVPTLVALTVFLIGAFAFQGVLDIIRSRIVVRTAALLDRHLGATVHWTVLRLAIDNRFANEAHQPVRDLDRIRTFMTGAGPIAFVDLPWMPVFLAICYLIHPWLGMLAFVGALALFGLTILTEQASRGPANEVAKDAGARASQLEASRRNSETAVAMGMVGTLAGRWQDVNNRFLGAMQRSSDVVGSYGSASRIFRLFLQSAILGLGAYLVIRQELSAGAMIAASLMMGRALMPIETLIANWRNFVAARQSVRRLSELLARVPPRATTTMLPKPAHSFEAEQLTVVAPGTHTAIVRDVSFSLGAGEALGIIGPSAAGKTSLVRTLVGIWPAARGTVRLDDAALDQWNPEILGQHVGFVSQAVELFEGTIAENIARMSMQPNAGAVLHAARMAGAHDMILRLPAGYDTKIGEAGVILSAGQRQRIALARAMYGDPFLLVLDEPGANLDNEGEIALQEAIREAKARGCIVIIIAHRPSALVACDYVLLLSDGVQRAFGPRDDILRKVIARPVQPAAVATSGLSVASQGGGRSRR
jgi:ATP-binding cassette subfamily C protein